MISKFVEIDPRKKLLPTIKKGVKKAENLWIVAGHNLIQWSVGKKKVTKDNGDVVTSDIQSMVQTSDKKNLFVSDSYGY
jgi:WD40 repeat protein